MIWLPIMIFGLVLDIIGIWLLASPLLKINLKHKEIIDKKTENALKEYQRVKGQKGGHPDSEIAMWPGVAELYAIVYQLYKKTIDEKVAYRNQAIIALIIITAGFSLQIFANTIQAYVLTNNQ